MYPYSNMHYFYYYYVSKCIVSKWLLYVSNIKRCFQYTGYVSKRLFMFPISNFCFQYPIHVSKWKWCFQTIMFPMYVSNIHRAKYYNYFILNPYLEMITLLVVCRSNNFKLKFLMILRKRFWCSIWTSCYWNSFWSIVTVQTCLLLQLINQQ